MLINYLSKIRNILNHYFPPDRDDLYDYYDRSDDIENFIDDTIDSFDTNQCKLNIQALTAPIGYIHKNIDKNWNWNLISMNLNIKPWFIAKYKKNIKFDILSKNPSITIKYIKAFPNVDWNFKHILDYNIITIKDLVNNITDFALLKKVIYAFLLKNPNNSISYIPYSPYQIATGIENAYHLSFCNKMYDIINFFKDMNTNNILSIYKILIQFTSYRIDKCLYQLVEHTITKYDELLDYILYNSKIHENIIRLTKNIRKHSNSVKIIENWWFDIYYDPSKYLYSNKKQKVFHQLSSKLSLFH